MTNSGISEPLSAAERAEYEGLTDRLAACFRAFEQDREPPPWGHADYIRLRTLGRRYPADNFDELMATINRYAEAAEQDQQHEA